MAIGPTTPAATQDSSDDSVAERDGADRAAHGDQYAEAEQQREGQGHPERIDRRAER